MNEKIPVILDTDIGDDIDDTWALIMMLRSPELDIRLIVGSSGPTQARAEYIAKILELAGRTDIPIGIGPMQGDAGTHRTSQARWIDDYDLSGYRGVVHADGARAIVETIRQSERPVTLVAIGPLPTVAEALRLDPSITSNSRFVGMHGSIYEGYAAGSPPCPETNVRVCTADCQHVFSSDWQMTITPLDTCGRVVLSGDQYGQILNSDDPLLMALMLNNRYYAADAPWVKSYDPDKRSSTLFDTVAIYLAFSEELLEIEELPIVVTEDGFTRVDQSGKMIRCATRWRDLPAFRELLVNRLLGR